MLYLESQESRARDSCGSYLDRTYVLARRSCKTMNSRKIWFRVESGKPIYRLAFLRGHGPASFGEQGPHDWCRYCCPFIHASLHWVGIMIPAILDGCWQWCLWSMRVEPCIRWKNQASKSWMSLDLVAYSWKMQVANFKVSMSCRFIIVINWESSRDDEFDARNFHEFISSSLTSS